MALSEHGFYAPIRFTISSGLTNKGQNLVPKHAKMSKIRSTVTSPQLRMGVRGSLPFFPFFEIFHFFIFHVFMILFLFLVFFLFSLTGSKRPSLPSSPKHRSPHKIFNSKARFWVREEDRRKKKEEERRTRRPKQVPCVRGNPSLRRVRRCWTDASDSRSLGRRPGFPSSHAQTGWLKHSRMPPVRTPITLVPDDTPVNVSCASSSSSSWPPAESRAPPQIGGFRWPRSYRPPAFCAGRLLLRPAPQSSSCSCGVGKCCIDLQGLPRPAAQSQKLQCSSASVPPHRRQQVWAPRVYSLE